MAKKDSNSPVMAKDNHDSESYSNTAEGAVLPVNRVSGIASQSAQPAEPYDPFAEENIRLPQELLDEAVVNTELTIVPVQKPSDQQFIRVNPDPAFQHTAALIELQEERGAKYLVHPSCVAEVRGYGIKFRFEQLFLYVNRQGNYFFWPLKLPTSNRENRWLETAREAAEKAMHKWVCVQADQQLGAYISTPAIDNDILPGPEWPEKNGVPLTKNELLSKAFRERLIMSADHPVIRKLRGAVL